MSLQPHNAAEPFVDEIFTVHWAQGRAHAAVERRAARPLPRGRVQPFLMLSEIVENGTEAVAH